MFRSASFIILVLLAFQVQAMPIDLSVISYTEKDKFSLVGDEKDIITSVYGASIGTQWWSGTRSQPQWGLGLKVGVGRAHTSNFEQDFTFHQTYLPVYFGEVSAKYNLLSNTEKGAPKLQLHLVLPILIRSVSYQEPALDSEFENKLRIISNFGLEVGWRLFEKVIFSQSIYIPLEDGVSPIWMIALGWDYGK